jgi:DNA modification methylase
MNEFINTIFNEDCLTGMKKIPKKSIQLIFTSPPYNMTKRQDCYNKRYDIYDDYKPIDEYVKWIVDIFKEYEKILKDNGTVAFNMSYGTNNPQLPYIVISQILAKTNFTIIDTIVWKKNNALPNNISSNRLTRICEFVYVFTKKGYEKKSFMNKSISSYRKTQPIYISIDNFIRAKNNDNYISEHQATFSKEFVNKIISIYSKKDDIVMDNFMGIGTTALSCYDLERKYVGFELSKNFFDISIERTKENEKQKKLPF